MHNGKIKLIHPFFRSFGLNLNFLFGILCLCV